MSSLDRYLPFLTRTYDPEVTRRLSLEDLGRVGAIRPLSRPS